MGLRVSSWYRSLYIHKIQLCPYHNPIATMGHNVDISKPLAHTAPYTLSAICLVQFKLGFIHEEHTFPVYLWPTKVSIFPLKSVTTPNCSQVKTLPRTTSTQMSFPETVSDSLCRNYSVVQTHPSAGRVACLRRSRRGRKQMLRSWAGVILHDLRLWGRLDVLSNSLKQRRRRLMVEILTLHSLATVLVDTPAVSILIARSLKTWDICGIVVCDKTQF